MIKFAEELIKNHLKEMDVLTQMNFEICDYKFLGDCSIDFNAYVKLQEEGLVKFFTAKTEDVLCGYAVFLITEHSHMKGSVVAKQDAIYLNKSARGLGDKFISWCEGKLKDAGVIGVISTVPASKDHTKYYESRGYKLIDRVYLKGLENGDRDSIDNRGISSEHGGVC